MVDSIEKDPRYPAAYQRGYDGPVPERLTRTEERFRRPRRSEIAAPARTRRDGRETRPTPEPALALEPALAPELETAEPTPEAPVALRAHQDDSAAGASQPAAREPLGRRVPATLVLLGAVLTAFGAFALWWAVDSAYGYTMSVDGVDPEQYTRLVLQFTGAPALTVGLLAFGAAAVAQAFRASRR